MAAGCCASLALQRTGQTPLDASRHGLVVDRHRTRRPSAASDGERLCSAGRDRRDRSDGLQGQQSTGFKPGGGAGFRPGQLCDVALSVAATAPTWIGTASVAMTAARRGGSRPTVWRPRAPAGQAQCFNACCCFHPQARSRDAPRHRVSGPRHREARLPRPRVCACCRPSNARARGSLPMREPPRRGAASAPALPIRRR